MAGTIRDLNHLRSNAYACYNQGDLRQAEIICQQILQQSSDDPEATHLLGLIALNAGRGEIAIKLFEIALQCTPSSALYHLSLGDALLNQGQTEAAVTQYREALRLNPAFLEAYNNLGNALKALGRLEEAVECYRAAIRINPKFAVIHYNLGNALRDLGSLEDAIAIYQCALGLQSDYAAAHYNLGNTFKELGQLDAAVESYRATLRLDADFADAWNNLGNVLQQLERLDEAIQCFEKVTSLKPLSSEAHNNLGTALAARGVLDKAILCYQEAIRLNPKDPIPYNNLAQTLIRREKIAEAVTYYRSALQLDPMFSGAHLNLSLALLSAGSLSEGWREHEWRWKAKGFPSVKRDFPQPWWQGEDMAGKTILVWAEQGLGDEILYASILPDIIARSGHCVVECDVRLVPLFARSFPKAEVVPRSNPPHPRTVQPDVHFQIPMGSLAHFFRNSLDSFPAHHGYLVADPHRTAYWKNRLATLGRGQKVGICWRSMWGNVTRNVYYTELTQWGPILSAQGIVFVNLQYDNCQPELDAAEQQFGINIHAWDDVDLKNDLDEAAALTAALDLVISAGTSVAAMAGALGVPIWELAANEGIWLTLGTDHMPWYPSLRLFLRAWNDGWEGPIQEIAHELQRVN